MRSEHSIFVRRSPAEVFAFIADVSTWKKWALRVVEVQREFSGTLRVDERFTVAARLYGRVIAMTYEVTHLDPGRRLAWRSVGGSAGEASFAFSVEPESDGARLTESVDMAPRGFLKLIGFLIKRTSDKQLAANHAAVKAALEAAPPRG